MANVHLDATEYQDHVVFMHHIQPGSRQASSFGLASSARLAGSSGPGADGAHGRQLQEPGNHGAAP